MKEFEWAGFAFVVTYVLHGLDNYTLLCANLHVAVSCLHTLQTFQKCLYSLSISTRLPFGSMHSKFYYTHTHTHVLTQHIHTDACIMGDHLRICETEMYRKRMQGCSHTVCACYTHSSMNDTFLKYYVTQITIHTYHKHTLQTIYRFVALMSHQWLACTFLA